MTDVADVTLGLVRQPWRRSNSGKRRVRAIAYQGWLVIGTRNLLSALVFLTKDRDHDSFYSCSTHSLLFVDLPGQLWLLAWVKQTSQANSFPWLRLQCSLAMNYLLTVVWDDYVVF